MQRAIWRRTEMVYGDLELLLEVSATTFCTQKIHAHRLGLLQFPRSPELDEGLSAEGILRIVGRDVFEKGLIFCAFSPDTGEFIRRAGDPAFKSLGNEALGRVGQRGQEVAGGLARGADKTAAGPKLLCALRWSKENLTALV